MKIQKLFLIAGLAIMGALCSCSGSDGKSETQKAAEAKLEKNAAFFAENGQKEGIVTTPSGLQYEVLVEGEGPKPGPTDEVLTHYEGRLLNGKVFDSSYERNEPISFPLNRVIAGWTEGLQLMNVGSKYRFYIPSELGYGERGAGRDIGPNEPLIFDVELLDIIKPEAANAEE